MDTSSDIVRSSPEFIAGLPPAWSCAAVAAESLWLAQRLQWETLLAWQREMLAAQSDLWDRWTSQYAGGVPLDA